MLRTVSLKRNADFKRLYRTAVSRGGKFMVVYSRRFYAGAETGRSRLGVAVSVKIGNAVRRNLVKRRLKECYRAVEAEFAPGRDIVVSARGAARDAPFEELKAEMRRLLRETAPGKPAKPGGAKR